ncbi:ACT domain-containing protein [Algirhabdus cladophorae]|uniref:ACT domain-containing protein n=1 Tax=Algirhabdus cladophorae TaxID=3377108 RepID=UPI003B845AB6
MSGETNLEVLIQTMTTDLVEGVYVFVTNAEIPSHITPRMMFQEAEGPTYIILQSQAKAAGIAYEFPCCMITLNIHSSLEAVGFMARIATELAKHDMGVNPVSGFFHDHLFVPEDRAQDAIAVLRKMSEAA